MTSKTTIPPQAYTREMLTKAFEWLKTQPQSVKDKVVSADGLVQLYLHSKRFGAPTLALLDENQPKLEDLISVENFKQDLKSLAQGLKQFEDSPSTPPAFSSSTFNTPKKDLKADEGDSMPYTQPPHNTYTAPSAPSPSPQEQSYQPAPTPPPAAPQPQPSYPPPQTSQTSSQSIPQGWDEKTFWAVKSTRERFNLSSDQEALRMLVATGFDRLRNSF